MNAPKRRPGLQFIREHQKKMSDGRAKMTAYGDSVIGVRHDHPPIRIDKDGNVAEMKPDHGGS